LVRKFESKNGNFCAIFGLFLENISILGRSQIKREENTMTKIQNIKDFSRTIKTARLELRPLESTIENARIIFDALKNENPEDYLYSPVVFPGILPKTAEEMLDKMKKWEEWDRSNGIQLYIFYSGQFVGFRRMQFFDWNDTFQFAEVFFIKSARRHGFADETMKFFERIAFEELNANRTIRWNNPQNTASKNLAIKNGYHLDGIHREESRNVGGGFLDNMIWSKLKTEYFS
jgi:ribosomal-protein-serine acetyltransferase